ncbi:LolA family protein [Sphingosinicella humi]|uniref:Cell envelope biogenesis protein LolA n=1 Tax=Allosphingosinicella humi TaxID=2068657 RepID=A0A2U2J6B3_9SPHN|nr:outer membrane lipoprotein carrier protein LolA [Sphingosinicella humi]PWG03874.1 cell envelope biogenesis protein LolA [Sphingosinicella humi]
MRLKTLAVATLPLALAAPAMVVAQSSSPLSQVQAHMKTVDTMTANFSQTGRTGQTLNGKLTMKRPGKVRFQYQKGVPMLIVGDGKALTMIDYEVDQVSRWPIGDSPLSVLLNPNKDLSGIAKVTRNDGQVLLIEARDPKKPEFGTITIAFAKVPSAPAGLMLEGWTALDAQNNRTTIKLSGQRYNVQVADSAFRWTDPRRRSPRG